MGREKFEVTRESLPSCREAQLKNESNKEGRAKRYSRSTLIQPYLNSTDGFVSYPRLCILISA